MHSDTKKLHGASLFDAGDLQRSLWQKAATANRAIQEPYSRCSNYCKKKYEECIKNSPGIDVDTTGIEYGVGHAHDKS